VGGPFTHLSEICGLKGENTKESQYSLSQSNEATNQDYATGHLCRMSAMHEY